MTTDSEVVLEAKGIIKTFGNHAALKGVDISFRRGEVHALLGENGAEIDAHQDRHRRLYPGWWFDLP